MSRHADKSGSWGRYPYPNTVSFHTTWTCSPEKKAVRSDTYATATKYSNTDSGVKGLSTLYLPLDLPTHK